MYNSLQKLGLKRKKSFRITIATTIYWLKYEKNLQIIQCYSDSELLKWHSRDCLSGQE